MRALLIAAVLVSATPAAAQDAAFEAQLRKAAAEYLAAEKGTGLSIGIVRDGRPFTYGFGSAAKGGPVPSADTRYEIGSIAKTMTALLLARAVIAGKARLDDDVRKYLDGAYPRLELEGEPVRLLHLANMTSGLPDNLPDLSALGPDPSRSAHAEALAPLAV